jgi:glutamate synthase domain-containing protein 1
MMEEHQYRHDSALPPGSARVKPDADSPKDMSGCAIAGICHTDGSRSSGRDIITSIANMHDRSNGLGGGFAAYGIYPDFPDHYALHLMYEGKAARRNVHEYLNEMFDIAHAEPIPTRVVRAIRSRPQFERVFLQPKPAVREQYYDLSDDDLVVMAVMHVNKDVEGAFVTSSGKNCGAFKGVGYPEDIGEFFGLEDYQAYTWTAHGRFPTNTSGWWGGAHPFGLLDWTVVHNGEISSYGTNRNYLANYGYICSLHTDTEVVAYMVDLLVRKHGLPMEVACMAMAPPFWSDIERMDPKHQAVARAVRMVYAPALLNGPFSILVGFNGGMIALNDRIKLRPMTVAYSGKTVYVASEESAVRTICADPKNIRQLGGGEPLIVRVEGVNDNLWQAQARKQEELAGRA